MGRSFLSLFHSLPLSSSLQTSVREETRGTTEAVAAAGAVAAGGAAAEKELQEVEEEKEGVQAAAGAGRGGAVPDVASLPPQLPPLPPPPWTEEHRRWESAAPPDASRSLPRCTQVRIPPVIPLLTHCTPLPVPRCSDGKDVKGMILMLKGGNKSVSSLSFAITLLCACISVCVFTLTRGMPTLPPFQPLKHELFHNVLVRRRLHDFCVVFVFPMHFSFLIYIKVLIFVFFNL